MIRLSIVIPVLNSHEVVRRQLLHFERIGLPDGVELIIVDDGSDPPLDLPSWVRGKQTHDTRPWTWAPARNVGARMAQGDYLLMTDIDHIVSRELIDYARQFTGQKIQFKREFGVLKANGEFTQDCKVLAEHGLLPQYHDLYVKPLPNNFVMRKDIFWELGGYREDVSHRLYPQGEDRSFKSKWMNWIAQGKGQVDTYRPTIYVWPSGQFCGDVDYNPFGLFHDLSRKTKHNHWHQKLLREQVC